MIYRVLATLTATAFITAGALVLLGNRRLEEMMSNPELFDNLFENGIMVHQ